MPAHTRPIFLAIAAFAAAMALLLHPSRAADQSGRVVRIRIDTATPAIPIPEDFLGFGYETSAVAQPDFFTAKNARMIQLYKNLGPHGLVRIGGNVSDHTRYDHDGTPAVKTEREVTVINRANLADLGEFARATGWQVMWGLNLGTGTKEEAVEEAIAVNEALGPALQSFEIGNEVDLMRKYAKDYDAYHAAYTDYKAAIRAKLPHAAFSGPDAAGSLAFVEKFVAAEASDLKLATHHYYRGGARSLDATIQRLLARDEAFDARLARLRDVCAEHRLGYRINEVNSFYGGGKEGVSDTFGSALWCLNYLFDLASHECRGANLETDINQLGFISHYSPIVHDAAGVCSARPEYYGMLAFATARGNGRAEMLKVEREKGTDKDGGKTEINLTAYATKDERGTIYLTVINKDLSQGAAVECPVPAGRRAAGAYRLRAESADAKSGVTFAGAAVNEDGTWSPGDVEAVPVAGGVARAAVPRASAVVLKFEPE